ncbi:disulfide bond formation protein B [Paraburkholderia caballeronis]|uniref:Disulfide bond formation protein B n=1 Tax=Paraburkholderia caballeronis TaxID=416943 RepID=A0A1H7USH5_9BURK|nr:disulfide bond formation protein B [Paraburkholderia caballeronis]PXW26663.1 disulfide bond formation protein DsbB [Paraburkholderia caballeronis]PXX02209.1 disulfide bond formation protein DsbB [Paraburkholderia caballeronis]RAK01366.1 disulfide bond formation protein DsbB [Paraburkholderia caballeronis]TDV06201.1 disulfide bond formation protein DsbB [Paraburkholderia caballeronis]TDV09703.1 disulfide bond formation protein DsbB [Paraburkholderia caballeronis]
MNDDNALLRRERGLLVLLALICVALLAGALYMQYIERQDPCPLCIIQRYFILLIAVFAFLGARLNSWRGVRVLETLAALSAFGGIIAAARLVYVQANPGFSCGFDALQPVVDGLPPARWLPGVFKVQGLCETTYPPVFGLSLPTWTLIAFVCIFVPLVLSLWRNRRRQVSWPGIRH